MTGAGADVRRIVLAMRRRPHLDFSDYLELRRARDLRAGGAPAGHDALADELDALIAHLEAALPVPFAGAIPNLATLDEPPAAPPRGLDREHLRVAFAMREEFARHGEARAGMMGIDLPERPGLPDWLDMVEAERKHARAARAALRELDLKIWALYTGVRRMPQTPVVPATTSRILHQ